MFPIIPCFSCERLCFKNNLNVFQINYQDNFLYTFEFKQDLVQHHTYVQIIYIILLKINHPYIKH